MPFGNYAPSIPPSIPTFLQFVKTISKGAENKTKFSVDLIWLPGRFNNVTLQTHAFRYICDENHPLYAETIAYCSGLVLGLPVDAIEIVITSIGEKTISVLENPKKKGNWEKMGENAFKFKP